MQGFTRILVLCRSTLTDLVCAGPALSVLRAHAPSATLVALLDKDHEDLYAGTPTLDRVLVRDRRRLHRGLPGLVRLRRLVRAQEWDLVVDFGSDLTSRLLARWARGGATVRIEPTLRWVRRHRRGRYFASCTKAEAFLRALVPLGVPSGTVKPRLWLRPEWTEAAKQIMKQCGLAGGSTVGMAPTARWETSRWPIERYAEVAKHLSCSGAQVLVFGLPDDKELCAKVAAGRAGVHDLSGRLSFGETLGVIARCTAFLGNDAGLTHCAQALGVPTVALFGPTDSRHYVFFPGRALQRTVPCGPCTPCGTDRCRAGDHACMAGIGVDEVIEAVKLLLPVEREPPPPLKW